MRFDFWNKKKKSEDPLLNQILEKYHLNLLSIPREDAGIGDLYFQDTESKNMIPYPGKITNFLDPPIKLPKAKSNEQMAHISGVVSKNISGNLAFDFIEGFINAIHGDIGTKIRASFERNNVSEVRFGFEDPKRDHIDPVDFGAILKKHKFNFDHPLYTENGRYYLVTGIAKTPSITIQTNSDKANSLTTDTDIVKIVKASSNITMKSNQSGQITFNGDKDLVFGVELFELKYDTEQKRFKMNMVSDAQNVRAPNPVLVDTVDNSSFIVFATEYTR